MKSAPGTGTLRPGLTRCADDGGTCSFSGTRAVAFGAGTYAFKAATGGTARISASFGGDPAANIMKFCYVTDAGGPWALVLIMVRLCGMPTGVVFVVPALFGMAVVCVVLHVLRVRVAVALVGVTVAVMLRFVRGAVGGTGMRDVAVAVVIGRLPVRTMVLALVGNGSRVARKAIETACRSTTAATTRTKSTNTGCQSDLAMWLPLVNRPLTPPPP